MLQRFGGLESDSRGISTLAERPLELALMTCPHLHLLDACRGKAMWTASRLKYALSTCRRVAPSTSSTPRATSARARVCVLCRFAPARGRCGWARLGQRWLGAPGADEAGRAWGRGGCARLGQMWLGAPGQLAIEGSVRLVRSAVCVAGGNGGSAVCVAGGNGGSAPSKLLPTQAVAMDGCFWLCGWTALFQIELARIP
eukprot:365640-Chlamydomonas_euryale.AAC.7